MWNLLQPGSGSADHPEVTILNTMNSLSQMVQQRGKWGFWNAEGKTRPCNCWSWYSCLDCWIVHLTYAATHYFQQVRGLHELVIFAKCFVVHFPLLTWETVLRRTRPGHVFRDAVDSHSIALWGRCEHTTNIHKGPDPTCPICLICLHLFYLNLLSLLDPLGLSSVLKKQNKLRHTLLEMPLYNRRSNVTV